MEGLERNTECLANISQKHIDYYDLLLPSIINWEKSETKEDLCNSLRWIIEYLLIKLKQFYQVNFEFQQQDQKNAQKICIQNW